MIYFRSLNVYFIILHNELTDWQTNDKYGSDLMDFPSLWTIQPWQIHIRARQLQWPVLSFEINILKNILFGCDFINDEIDIEIYIPFWKVRIYA